MEGNGGWRASREPKSYHAIGCCELMRVKAACNPTGLFPLSPRAARHCIAITEGLVNSRIPLAGLHLVNFRRQPVQRLERRALQPRLPRGASWVLILLLSLGLWAAIWAVFDCLASAGVG